jgi:hypothetical protein
MFECAFFLVLSVMGRDTTDKNSKDYTFFYLFFIPVSFCPFNNNNDLKE